MDTTLQSIIEIALQQGIWAALYIYLFFRMAVFAIMVPVTRNTRNQKLRQAGVLICTICLSD